MKFALLKSLLLFSLLMISAVPSFARPARTPENKVCPLAMIVFVDGGTASPSHPHVLKIRDAFESEFGVAFPVSVVSGAGDLKRFDYALAVTINKVFMALTVNVRDVVANRVIRSEQESYIGRRPDDVLTSLAQKVNRSTVQRGLVGDCR